MNAWRAVRSALFAIDPERAHHLALSALAIAPRLPGVLSILERGFRFDDPALEMEVLGLHFANPVGLAAGFDKNARVLDGLAALGFGSLEVGGVTAEARAGNPRPRIRRERRERALMNWMGLPNEGAAAIAARLEARTARRAGPRPVIGLNVAGESVEGYLRVLQLCGRFVDYATLNVSCPNVPAVAQLADPREIRALLQAARASDSIGIPLLLKVSPDLTLREVDTLVEIAAEGGAAGFVAANTSAALAGEQGGISGAPLRERSTQLVRQIYRQAGDRLAVVGVGGVSSAEEAFEKIAAGASLVQVYTGFVYGGPSIAREINRGLVRLLCARGFSHLSEAVGCESGALRSTTRTEALSSSRA